MKAQGNVAPVRVIQGPNTQFNWPTGLAIDEQRGELYVANDIGNSILVAERAALKEETGLGTYVVPLKYMSAPDMKLLIRDLCEFRPKTKDV